MKLIDLLVKELPNRGGWPERAKYAWQDWDKEVRPESRGFGFYANELADNHRRRGEDNPEPGDENCVTRAQYESALAKNDGWIEWGGGECPVEESTNVDIRFEDGSEKIDVPASAFIWQHDDDITTIISYRPHRDINSRANDDRLERELNECIGQDVDMPEWSGDGFPPAGCKCEVMVSNPLSVFDKWTSCTVIHFNLREGRETQVCIIDDNGDFAILYGNDGVKFRPLRTEAEKSIEAATHSILDILKDYDFEMVHIRSDQKRIATDIVERIFAGQVVGVKPEVK